MLQIVKAMDTKDFIDTHNMSSSLINQLKNKNKSITSINYITNHTKTLKLAKMAFIGQETVSKQQTQLF